MSSDQTQPREDEPLAFVEIDEDQSEYFDAIGIVVEGDGGSKFVPEAVEVEGGRYELRRVDDVE